MKKSFFLLFTSLFSVCTLFASELQRDINRATNIINDFGGIPSGVSKNAKGVAIISVVKGGFIFSGRIGSGLVVARNKNGWSAPSAIGMGGAGFGWQIGAQVTDFVFILNTSSAVDAFAQGGSVTLGGNLSIAAGPVGGALEADIGLPPVAIFSYSRSQGIFAGASLEGTIILERDGVNRAFYGKSVSAYELLSGKIPRPESAKSLYNALDKF